MTTPFKKKKKKKKVSRDIQNSISEKTKETKSKGKLHTALFSPVNFSSVTCNDSLYTASQQQPFVL